MNRNYQLTWAFWGGLIVDIFSDTPGLNALSCTVLAMAKPYLLYLYLPKDDGIKNISPSIQTIGFVTYSKYLISMILIYCSFVFGIEYMTFADVSEIITMTISSTILSFGILLALDCLIVRTRY